MDGQVRCRRIEERWNDRIIILRTPYSVVLLHRMRASERASTVARLGRSSVDSRLLRWRKKPSPLALCLWICQLLFSFLA